MDIWKDTRVL